MSGKGGFFASRKYKLFTKYLSGFGASIVIVGALFKIMHWPGCDIMLIVGLLTEAAIFEVNLDKDQNDTMAGMAGMM